MTVRDVSVARTTGPSEAELLRRVEELAPVVTANVAWAEANRRMAPAVYEALSGAGMFALWKTRAVGGYETDPVIAFKVFEALATIDASVGWAVANQDGIDTMAGAVLGTQGALEATANPNAPISGASFPPGVARRDDGGYRVTGRWTFSSTCHYAQTYMGSALLHDDNGLVLGDGGRPVGLLVFTNNPEVQIIDTWRTLGMRGSGSHDIAMDDVFIPDHLAGLTGRTGTTIDGPFSGPLFGMVPWLSIATSGPIGLGIAEAALQALIELAGAKTPNYTTRPLRDRDGTQATVGRCRALINSARIYLHQSVETIYERRAAGETVPTAAGLDVQLATSNALELAPRVTEMVHSVVGSTGFQENVRFEQLFRDAHTLGQNTFASTTRYEAVGQVLLGMPTDWPILAWGLSR